MITPKYLAVCAFAVGSTLAGCHSDAFAGPSAESSVKQSVDDPTSANRDDIRLTYVEFLVPADRVPELLEKSPDFTALLAAAKSGKVGVLTSSLRGKDGRTSTIKEVTLVRFPSSHALVENGPDEATGSAATTPASEGAKPRVNEKPPQVIPQDFEVREVGFTLEYTPTILADRKTAELDLAPRRVIMETAPGAHPDASGFPCPPVFSANEMRSMIAVKNHIPALLATLQPAQNADPKEPRTRVVFIRADWGE